MPAPFCYNGFCGKQYGLTGGSEMEPRVETAYLLDFYGALLTPKRREMLRMRYEEDMSLSEIGAQMGVSRQAVSDGMVAARKKLEEYEAKLGLVRRYLAITAEAGACLQALDADDRAGARRHLQNILQIER